MAPTHPHLRHLQGLLTEAIIRVCEHQAPFVQKLKIEGTLCVTADSDSFVVTHITETLVKTRRDLTISPETENDQEGAAKQNRVDHVSVDRNLHVNSSQIGGTTIPHNQAYCEDENFFMNYASYGLEPGEIPKTKDQLMSQLMSQRSLPQHRQYTSGEIQRDPRPPSNHVLKQSRDSEPSQASDYKEQIRDQKDNKARVHSGPNVGIIGHAAVFSTHNKHQRTVECWATDKGSIANVSPDRDGHKQSLEAPPCECNPNRLPERTYVTEEEGPVTKRRRLSSESSVLDGFGDSFGHIVKSETTPTYYSESIDRTMISYGYPPMAQLHTMEFRAEEMVSQARRGTKHSPAQTYFNELLRMCASKAGIWKDGPKLRDVRPDQKDRLFLLIESHNPELRHFRSHVWARLAQALNNRRQYLASITRGGEERDSRSDGSMSLSLKLEPEIFSYIDQKPIPNDLAASDGVCHQTADLKDITTSGSLESTSHDVTRLERVT